MDIGKFRDLAASTQMGRARLEERDTNQAPFSETTVTAPNRSSTGKLFSRIGDFFSRATKSGKETQATQNREVRQSFAEALRRAYPNAQSSVIDKVTQHSTKPLMVRDIKAIMTDVELSNKVGAMRFTVPTSNQPISISPSLIPRSTLQSVDNLQTELQGKIDRGRELVDKLRHNTEDKPVVPSKKDVSDIMWFLHVSAEGKAGAPFKAGAITVDDPGGRIREYLDRSGEVYQRKSSHIGGFQKVDGGAHRGIDFGGAPNNLDELLPNGRSTVLYGRLAQGTQQMPREMLFLKMESHGCRLASPSSKIRDGEGHGPQDRKVKLGHDLKAFFGHAFSFLGGIGERSSGNHAADSRKERVNKPFIEGYKNLVSQMPDAIKEILNRDDPLSKSGGIRVMSNNIDLVRDGLMRGVGGHVPQPQFEEINLLDEDAPPVQQQPNVGQLVLGPNEGINRQTAIELDQLLEQASNLLLNAYDDGDIHLRIGNEVILAKEDF